MRDTTKYLLQAIGSISGEIRELRNDLKNYNDNMKAIITLHERTDQIIESFKISMEKRFMAVQQVWETHLINHLHRQTDSFNRILDCRLPKIKKVKYPKKKKSVKKTIKRKRK